MLSVGRGAFPDVDSHIQNGTLYDPHQLCLGMLSFLEMQSAHDSE